MVNTNFLKYLTVLFITISAISYFKIQSYEDSSRFLVDESDIDRNENSTPRTFILPSTPAVVDAQESKQKLISRGLNSDRCLAKLKDLGYPIDDLNPEFNAKYVEAIINYQILKNIPVTGSLDKLTTKNLNC